jgi:Zn-dependent metalloprotease
MPPLRMSYLLPPALAVAASAGMLVLAGGFTHAQSPSARLVAITAVGDAARGADRSLQTMQDRGAMRLVKSTADTLIEGRVHDRFDQYVGGVRVAGGQLVRQRSSEGVVSLFGNLYSDVVIDVEPALSSAAALARVEKIVGRPAMTNVAPELVVLPRAEGPRLGWVIHARIPGDIVRLVVDAHTGEEVERSSVIRRQSAVGTGTGVFGDRKKMSASNSGGSYVADDRLRPPALRTLDLRGNLDRVFSILDGLTPAPSDVASDTDNNWTDGAVVDAHTYIGYTYDYYFKRFNRRGIDDSNRPIQAITHPILRSDVPRYFEEDPDVFGLFAVNAFWCGVCGPNGIGMMVFGEGLPANVFNVEVDYFSGALDVVAHEVSHGLTEYTSALDGPGETGALNEGFSDIIGIGVEFFFQEPGDARQRAEYLIGEDIVRPMAAFLVRSAADPGRFGDPDHYSRRYTGPEDSGGVHTNATIPTHAFYLAIEGGTNRTSGLAVQGVGAANRERIERVFFRAFTTMLPSSANFSIARQATLQAATDLYGGSSAEFRAVQQAWTAVGVQ